MTWSTSSVFAAWIQGTQGQGGSATAPGVLPGSYAGLSTDTVKVALFNNTTAPDNTAARTSTGFNTGTWTQNVGNEVIDSGGSNWPTGGQTLASKTLVVGSPAASNVFTFDAADLSGLGNVTLTNAFGCLVYDSTVTAVTGGVAKQGVCYNYFGGGQSVTAGTFTIVWNSSGLFTVTCT